MELTSADNGLLHAEDGLVAAPVPGVVVPAEENSTFLCLAGAGEIASAGGR